MIEGTGIAEQNRPFQGTVIAEHSQHSKSMPVPEPDKLPRTFFHER